MLVLNLLAPFIEAGDKGVLFPSLFPHGPLCLPSLLGVCGGPTGHSVLRDSGLVSLWSPPLVRLEFLKAEPGSSASIPPPRDLGMC